MTDDAEVVLIGIGTVAAPAHSGAPHAREGTKSRLREPALVPAFPDS